MLGARERAVEAPDLIEDRPVPIRVQVERVGAEQVRHLGRRSRAVVSSGWCVVCGVWCVVCGVWWVVGGGPSPTWWMNLSHDVAVAAQAWKFVQAFFLHIREGSF